MTKMIRLVSYARGSPLLADALAVYARVWPERDRAESEEGFTRYAGYAEFRGLVAFAGDEPVGVGYGARSVPGIPWHDLVAPVLGFDHPALQDAWRLVELAVVSECRGAGIGGRLHDALLASQPCGRALLSTAVSNWMARRMYERRGWEYVVTDFQVPGDFRVPGQSERYVIMGRRTPLREAGED
jgi:ribosomal protein S18 acetylase RimI-like enzyme